MTGGHATDITALAYSYNLSLIASASSDATLQIWDYEVRFATTTWNTNNSSGC